MTLLEQSVVSIFRSCGKRLSHLFICSFFLCLFFVLFCFIFFLKKLNSVNELQLNPNMYESIFKHKNIFWLSASRLFDLRLWDLDSLVEKCPGYTLVAGRRREGAVVAVVVPQILRQQRPDVKRRDVDLLICQRVWQRERDQKKHPSFKGSSHWIINRVFITREDLDWSYLRVWPGSGSWGCCRTLGWSPHLSGELAVRLKCLSHCPTAKLNN